MAASSVSTRLHMLKLVDLMMDALLKMMPNGMVIRETLKWNSNVTIVKVETTDVQTAIETDSDIE